MNKTWYVYIGWTSVAGLLDFAISYIFAGVLRLPLPPHDLP